MQPEPEKRPELKDLQEILAGGATPLDTFLSDVRAADLAEWLYELEELEVARVFAALDLEGRVELLLFSEDPVRQTLLAGLNEEELRQVIEEMPADEVVDLLALTDEKTAERVLRRVDFERAQGLRELASYEADTAGGLMTSEFVTVQSDVHVGDAIKEIRSEEGPAGEEEIGVFVVDENGRPVGFVSDRELLTTGIHTPVAEVMDDDVITVGVDEDQEEVGNLVSKYSLSAVPVVDDQGVLIGVVSAEDALEALEDEVEEDIRRLVGTSPDEQTHLSISARVRTRIPLQALTVVGGLVTAFILDKALPGGGEAGRIDILRYLPIIIGLAGNVGIQSSTILVRAYATGELSQERESSVLGSEVIVGLMIGLLCGAATMCVATFMEGDPTNFSFGLALGCAIVVAVTWASFLGCVVPMSCQRFGIDPAIVAGPFLITLSDISGAAIFVGVAHLTLGLA